MGSIMRAAVTAAALALLAGQAGAQMPFEGPRDMSKPPACTKDYIAGLDLQVKALDKVRTAGPELVGQVCTLIEQGSEMVGGELSDTTRQRLKGMLGFDLDLRFIKAQCRQGQGNLDREILNELGYLKSEQIRCSANTI
ncbi:MAG: hypothetical protein EKK41_17865 [Hyphomicrobiales bacterium]|nr:MAG: hypothetical protein EKK41_17865 [Hyphomicrobiales bacterium]